MADGTDINLRLTWDDPKSGETMEKTFSLPLTVGREGDNDLVIMSTSVSRRHAELTLVGDRILVTDQQSSNGTYVNGSRIERAYLNEGDEIIFGEIKVQVAFTRDRRSSRPSMDHLYGALADGEAQPTITIKSIRGRSGLFADISESKKQASEAQAPVSESATEDRLSGDELKAFINRRLQKNMEQDISPDIEQVAMTYERQAVPEPAITSPKPETPFPQTPSHVEETPKQASGIMGFLKKLFGG